MNKVKNLWFFAGWGQLSKNRRKLLLEFKTTDVVLGINKNKNTFQYYNRDKIISDCKWLNENNINIHLMVWMSRTQSFILQFIDNIISLLSELDTIKPTSILLDTEKNWIKNTYNTKDYMNRNLATSYINNFRLIMKGNDIKLGVTSLLKIPEAVKSIAKLSDYVIPQAYSVYFPRSTKHWSHNQVFDPITAQEIAYNSWYKYNKNIVMGLACYYEKRYSWTQLASLTSCLKTTLDLGIREVAYWDIKQCIGKKLEHQTRIDFMKTIMNDNPLKFDMHDWKTLQTALDDMNYEVGEIDGIWGPISNAALNAFRKNFELVENVPLNNKDLITLLDNYVF